MTAESIALTSALTVLMSAATRAKAEVARRIRARENCIFAETCFEVKESERLEARESCKARERVRWEKKRKIEVKERCLFKGLLVIQVYQFSEGKLFVVECSLVSPSFFVDPLAS